MVKDQRFSSTVIEVDREQTKQVSLSSFYTVTVWQTYNKLSVTMTDFNVSSFDMGEIVYTEAKASVPYESNNLGGRVAVAEWVTEYEIFLRGLAQQWRARQKQNLAQG